MIKTMRILGVASTLALAAAPCFAAGGSLGSQHTTQTQLDPNGQNQMLSKPATGSATTSNGTYGMNNAQTGSAYSRTPTSTTSGPGTAINPGSPSGGGGVDSGSSGGSGGTGR